MEAGDWMRWMLKGVIMSTEKETFYSYYIFLLQVTLYFMLTLKTLKLYWTAQKRHAFKHKT